MVWFLLWQNRSHRCGKDKSFSLLSLLSFVRKCCIIPCGTLHYRALCTWWWPSDISVVQGNLCGWARLRWGLGLHNTLCGMFQEVWASNWCIPGQKGRSKCWFCFPTSVTVMCSTCTPLTSFFSRAVYRHTVQQHGISPWLMPKSSAKKELLCWKSPSGKRMGRLTYLTPNEKTLISS